VEEADCPEVLITSYKCSVHFKLRPALKTSHALGLRVQHA